MTLRALLLFGLISLPAAALAQANKEAPVGTFLAPNTKPDLAFGAYQRGYYLDAMREAKKRVAENPKDGAALALIGELYRNGLGIDRSTPDAIQWYRRAAEAGDAQGAFALAIAYLRGEGVKPDVQAARGLLQQAAQKNHAGALHELGMLDLEGELQNPARAADYFARAAALGNSESAYALGLLYKAGRGVTTDKSKAAQLMKQAADLDFTAAQIEYAIMLFNGDGTAKDETGAARLFMKAAKTGNPIAANRLARLYASGRGVERNMQEAMKWHLFARNAGLKDDWLDAQLNSLSPAERAAAEAAMKPQSPF